MTHFDEFRNNVDLIEKVGERLAYLTCVMGLYIDDNDLLGLASEALTDATKDRKIDFIKLDLESERIVVAQAYYSSKDRGHAPTGKSTELNTALAWLLSGDLAQVPDKLRAVIDDCRAAIASGEVTQIHALFVHNLPESEAVEQELNTTRTHIESFFQAERDSESRVSIVVKEVGQLTVTNLQAANTSPLQVSEAIECSTSLKIKEVGEKWTAYVCTVSGTWLHALFAKHGDALFSANYRGFLGGGRKGKINTGIRNTAEASPGDFWVYNNGITILTSKVEKLGNGIVKLHGMSIINGAQTTGSLGQVDGRLSSLAGVAVLCRFIECADSQTIRHIVQYNNTQNEITTWDQYSNDPMQVALREQFQELGYDYRIKRTSQSGANSVLFVSDFAQPSLAFLGRWNDANRGRNVIFDRHQLYQLAFEGCRARHLLFAYSLKLAIDNCRLDLKQRSEQGLTSHEEKHLSMLRHLKFKNFLIAVIARSLETVISKKVDLRRASFKESECALSKRNLKDLAVLWVPLVNTILGLVAVCLKGDELPENLAKEDALSAISEQVNGLLNGLLSTNPGIFSDFCGAVEP